MEGYYGIPRAYSGNTLGNTWGILGEYLGNKWGILGEYLGNTWAILGQYLGNAWAILGQYLGNTWAILGQKCFGSDNFASPYSVSGGKSFTFQSGRKLNW